jgi:hypothetical protein
MPSPLVGNGCGQKLLLPEKGTARSAVPRCRPGPSTPSTRNRRRPRRMCSAGPAARVTRCSARYLSDSGVPADNEATARVHHEELAFSIVSSPGHGRTQGTTRRQCAAKTDAVAPYTGCFRPSPTRLAARVRWVRRGCGGAPTSGCRAPNRPTESWTTVRTKTEHAAQVSVYRRPEYVRAARLLLGRDQTRSRGPHIRLGLS